MWRLPPGAGAAVRWAPVGDEASVALTVEQITYPSSDGTEIGLFVLRRPDVTPSPDVPMILNGYGGFAISETPVWSPQIVAWCEAGGVYAIAGLRGGLEHGEAWHHAGRRAHKQNVFDDFHAAADWLVDTGRASRERLAIVGRSNGGLLVGVALTQRPDLCRAVWCGVPLLDMIRFPQFLIARLWTSEYGDPDVAEEFAWLWGYSPYHHVTDGTCYPATLFTTAEGDSRVDPLHARKMAALVQAATSCADERPVLLHQEDRAGHGVGKPVSKRADELADGLAFLGVSGRPRRGTDRYGHVMTIDHDDDLVGLRAAARAVAEARDAMLTAAIPGATTGELDAIGREVLARHGANPAPPTVGFPGCHLRQRQRGSGPRHPVESAGAAGRRPGQRRRLGRGGWLLGRHR